MSLIDDKSLVQRCQAELPYNTSGFEVLMRRYESVVLTTCMRCLNHRQEAEEAAQDVWMRAFRGLAGYRGDSAFKTWLFRLVTNVCRDRQAVLWRRTRRETSLESDVAKAVDLATEDPPRADTPMDLAMEALRPGDRTALVLRHVAGLSVEEIGQALGVGLSAAKMRISRAEDRLRQLYIEYAASKK